VKKVLVTAALAAGLIGSLWSLAFSRQETRETNTRFVFSERRSADSTTAPGASTADTIAGPRNNVQNARRIVFRVSNAHVQSNAAVCSLAVIQVTNLDSTNADEQAGPYLGWVDANGLAGATVIDNLSNQPFGDSLGYRTIELAAPGSGRIPWRWARCVVKMKQGASAWIYGLRIVSITSDD
jgi:hypothetical protein